MLAARVKLISDGVIQDGDHEIAKIDPTNKVHFHQSSSSRARLRPCVGHISTCRLLLPVNSFAESLDVIEE